MGTDSEGFVLGLAVKKFCTLHSGMIFEKAVAYVCCTELFYSLTKLVFLINGNHRITIDLKWKSDCNSNWNCYLRVEILLACCNSYK